MGWGDCGFDSTGRPIGYLHDATCDEPGCTEQIDRGLAHACGGMHGEFDEYCEKYFCSEHLLIAMVESKEDPDSGGLQQICDSCLTAWADPQEPPE